MTTAQHGTTIKTTGDRYTVRDVREGQAQGIGRTVREPWQVIDTESSSIEAEYKSLRAARMHAADLNRDATVIAGYPEDINFDTMSSSDLPPVTSLDAADELRHARQLRRLRGGHFPSRGGR